MKAKNKKTYYTCDVERRRIFYVLVLGVVVLLL
jgi:hypothetical protein